MQQAPLAIKTTNLNHSFGGRVKAVDEVSIEVPQGSIFGFLGPNGAGKTTTMRLLTGTLSSEGDNIWLMGKSLKTSMPGIFTGIGTLIETPSLYLHLTGRENLKIVTTLRGLDHSKIDEVLRLVGLFDARNRKVKQYSLGMKQRLGIAMALLPEPSLLMLDEPANGLDPTGMIEMREMLKTINRQKGTTIFISSHLLYEVEKTCTHVGIIHRGKMRYQGKLGDLHQSVGAGRQAIFTVNDPLVAVAAVKESYPSALVQNNKLVIDFSEEEEVATINRLLVEKNISVLGIQTHEGLEEWFMKIISN